jgi:hypothetical protein
MTKQVGNRKLTTLNNKKSSQGGRNSQIKLSSMNKNQKRSFKKSRGQGKAC